MYVQKSVVTPSLLHADDQIIHMFRSFLKRTEEVYNYILFKLIIMLKTNIIPEKKLGLTFHTKY